MAFYGIEETTDHRHPETKIVKLKSRVAAMKWLRAGTCGFAWPGAANPDLPMDAQNFHRRIRTCYETKSAVTLRMAKARNKREPYHHGHNKTDMQMWATMIHSAGKRLLDETPTIDPGNK